MRKDKELGSITPGKFADVILVSGDPTKNISDIRRVDVVIKNGEVYRQPKCIQPSEYVQSKWA
jgi:imidazolonepropionase-like amidohydrolase